MKMFVVEFFSPLALLACFFRGASPPVVNKQFIYSEAKSIKNKIARATQLECKEHLPGGAVFVWDQHAVGDSLASEGDKNFNFELLSASGIVGATVKKTVLSGSLSANRKLVDFSLSTPKNSILLHFFSRSQSINFSTFSITSSGISTCFRLS